MVTVDFVKNSGERSSDRLTSGAPARSAAGPGPALLQYRLYAMTWGTHAALRFGDHPMAPGC